MKKETLSISKKSIVHFLFFLYLVCFSTYNKNIGFDDYIVKIIPIILLITTIILYKENIKISYTLKWFSFFWIFYILSFLWSGNKQDTLELIPNILYLFPAIFCVPIIINDKKDLNKLLKIVLAAVIYSIVAIIWRSSDNQIGYSRIGEVIGLSPNAVGMRCAICTCTVLYFMHEDKNNKFIKIFLLGIFILFSLLSGSRKATIMLIVGISSYEILMTKGIKIFLKTFAVFILACTMLYFIFNNTRLYNVLGLRFENMILQMTNGGVNDGSVIERNFYIEQAISLFKNNIIKGVGGNGFVSYMRIIRYKHIAYCHNNFFELLSTLGIIGFLIYYSAWIKTEIILLKMNNNKKTNITLLFIVTIGLWLIMDYWNVSYYDVFHILLISLARRYTEIEEIK